MGVLIWGVLFFPLFLSKSGQVYGLELDSGQLMGILLRCNF